jgi:hypothetical protein
MQEKTCAYVDFAKVVVKIAVNPIPCVLAVEGEEYIYVLVDSVLTAAMGATFAGAQVVVEKMLKNVIEAFVQIIKNVDRGTKIVKDLQLRLVILLLEQQSINRKI